MDCPSDEIFVELLEGTLDPGAAEGVERHVDRCTPCRRLLAEIARQGALAPTAIEEDDVAVPPRAAPLYRGMTVGRYVVLDVIGAGGMGVVYAAYDPELDRRVALKLLRSDLGPARAAIRARLVREARAMALLSHPNVITVYDAGSYGDEVFIAMELLDGGTLAAHLAARTRPAREVLDLFARAGAGLAAAHAAGLVHRDFKPENVLIGADGRVRVTDFGLARRAEDAEKTDGAGAPLGADAFATAAGVRLGTPAYMAPEQHDGRTADARSDQFAFCVALYEALYGERPFPGATVAEIARAVRSGRVRVAPPGARVPAWLRAVLLRGLRTAPEERFPSMRALLDALGRDPTRRLRRAAAAGGAIAAIGIAMVLLRHRPAPPAEPPCRAAAAALSAVWNDDKKQAIAGAFTATGKPYAVDAQREATRQLDAYAAAWSKARTDACEATRVRGEQSEKMLELRAGCLDRRLDALSAVARLLGTADAEVVVRAAQAARSLSKIEGCSAEALRGLVEPSGDLQARRRREEAEARLTEARALEAVGKYAEAAPAAEGAVTLARAADHAPLEAEALIELGKLRLDDERDADAERTFYEALWAAESGRNDAAAAEAWSKLVFVVGYKQNRFDEGERLARHAEAAIRRLGGDDQLEAALCHYRGLIAGLQRRADVAAAHSERAVALASRSMAPDDPRLVVILEGVGASRAAGGELSAALALIRRALEVEERVLGPRHPDVAHSLEALGQLSWALGRYDEAVAAMRRAVSIYEGALPPESAGVVLSHGNLAEVLRSAGQPAEALAELDFALRFAPSHFGREDANVAELRAVRAEVLERLGRHREALDEARAAVPMAIRAEGPRGPHAANVRTSVARVLLAQRDFDAAFEQYRELEELERTGGGPELLSVAHGLTGMGICEVRRGHAERAVDPLERALALREGREGDPRDLADTRFALAEALWAKRGGRERALSLARRAAETYAAMGAATLAERAAADAWLAAHP